MNLLAAVIGVSSIPAGLAMGVFCGRAAYRGELPPAALAWCVGAGSAMGFASGMLWLADFVKWSAT